MACVMQLLQPRDIAAWICSRGEGFPSERRISHDRVKSWVIPIEYLWKLDLPVEWRQWWGCVTPLQEDAAIALRLSTRNDVAVFGALLFSFSWALALEKGSQQQTAEAPQLAA